MPNLKTQTSLSFIMLAKVIKISEDGLFIFMKFLISLKHHPITIVSKLIQNQATAVKYATKQKIGWNKTKEIMDSKTFISWPILTEITNKSRVDSISTDKIITNRQVTSAKQTSKTSCETTLDILAQLSLTLRVSKNQSTPLSQTWRSLKRYSPRSFGKATKK